MGNASGVVSRGSELYSTSPSVVVTPFTEKSSDEIQPILAKLPSIINPQLQKAMLLLSSFPSFRKNFLFYFGCGRWINEFLDTNANLTSLSNFLSMSSSTTMSSTSQKGELCTDDCSLPPVHALKKQMSNISLNSTESNGSGSLMVLDIRTDDSICSKPIKRMRQSKGPVKQASYVRESFKNIRSPWMLQLENNADETLAFLLVIAFPIYLLSNEFQYWLEFKARDSEEDIMTKRLISKETQSFRILSADPSSAPTRKNANMGSSGYYLEGVENDDDDDIDINNDDESDIYSASPSRFEITLHRSNNNSNSNSKNNSRSNSPSPSKIKLALQRHGSYLSSNLDVADDYVHENNGCPSETQQQDDAKKRMKKIIQQSMVTHPRSRLEEMLTSTAWAAQLVSFLHSSPLPIVIARARNRTRKRTWKELFTQGRDVFRKEFLVVYANQAYEQLTQYSLLELRNSSLSEVLLGKEPRILQDHNIVSSESTDTENQLITSRCLQWTVESKRKDQSSFVNLTVIKPVHHVVAEPDHHYVVALQYDLSVNLTTAPSLTSSFLTKSTLPMMMDASQNFDDVDMQTIDNTSVNNETTDPSLSPASVMYTLSAKKPQVVKNVSMVAEPYIEPANLHARDSIMSTKIKIPSMSSLSSSVNNSSIISKTSSAGNSTAHANVKRSTSLSSLNALPTSQSHNCDHNLINVGSNDKLLLNKLTFDRFQQDLPMIEDVLNFVPQFLY